MRERRRRLGGEKAIGREPAALAAREAGETAGGNTGCGDTIEG